MKTLRYLPPFLLPFHAYCKITVRILMYCMTMLLFTPSLQCAVLHVSKNDSLTQHMQTYSAIQDAVDNAASEDTILIHPGTEKYDRAEINKHLYIFGPGYNTPKDYPVHSLVDGFTLEAGGADSTVISGLRFKGDIILTDGADSSYTLHHVKINNNYFYHSRIYQEDQKAKQLFIRNNIFESFHLGIGVLNVEPEDSESIYFQNNIVISGGSAGRINAGPYSIISNNLFISSAESSVRAFNHVEHTQIQNNIFYGMSPYPHNSSSQYLNYTYNLTYQTKHDSLPPAEADLIGTQNIIGEDPEFENLPLSSSWDFDNDPALTNNSPAKNAGSNGEDLGPLGGSHPFTRYYNGGARLPYIEYMNFPGLLQKGEEYEIYIRAVSE